MSIDLISNATCWADFERSLAALGADQKGRLFEELTRLYLLTDPTFATKLTVVWHHSSVPTKVADELDLQRPEIGVDLIARTRDGDYWAIQCKFHQDRTQNVTYDELKTFLSITERRQTYERLSHRLVCTSADGVSERVQAAHPHKLGYLTAADFSALGPEEFRRFREFLAGQKPTFHPASPRPHQQRAIENAIKHFKDGGTDKGQAHPPLRLWKELVGLLDQ